MSFLVRFLVYVSGQIVRMHVGLFRDSFVGRVVV